MVFGLSQHYVFDTIIHQGCAWSHSVSSLRLKPVSYKQFWNCSCLREDPTPGVNNVSGESGVNVTSKLWAVHTPWGAQVFSDA